MAEFHWGCGGQYRLHFPVSKVQEKASISFFPCFFPIPFLEKKKIHFFFPLCCRHKCVARVPLWIWRSCGMRRVYEFRWSCLCFRSSLSLLVTWVIPRSAHVAQLKRPLPSSLCRLSCCHAFAFSVTWVLRYSFSLQTNFTSDHDLL